MLRQYICAGALCKSLPHRHIIRCLPSQEGCERLMPGVANVLSGFRGWYNTLSAQYGESRWSKIYAALLQKGHAESSNSTMVGFSPEMMDFRLEVETANLIVTVGEGSGILLRSAPEADTGESEPSIHRVSASTYERSKTYRIDIKTKSSDAFVVFEGSLSGLKLHIRSHCDDKIKVNRCKKWRLTSLPGCFQLLDECLNDDSAGSSHIKDASEVGQEETSENPEALQVNSHTCDHTFGSNHKLGWSYYFTFTEKFEKQLYFLDWASALAAYAVSAKHGDKVFDLCAAPGGKALILASNIFNRAITSSSSGNYSGVQNSDFSVDASHDRSLLVCNEFSNSRRQRLIANFSSRDIFRIPLSRNSIQFSGFDATGKDALRRFMNFDKILIDAPCTSDKHLLGSFITGTGKWSPGIVQRNHERQLQILLTASKMLQRGTIVYCTCALSSLENDKVIESFLRKSKGRVNVLPVFSNELATAYGIEILGNTCSIPQDNLRENQWIVEKTAYGVVILPDVCDAGPLYISKLEL